MTPAEQHAQDAALFAEIAASASASDWDRPSPVAGWTARDVVAHLVEWLPDFLERADITLPPVSIGDDPAAAWDQRAADVQALLDEQSDRRFESPMFGVTTVGAILAQIYINDIWMHSWDLARALGQDIDLGEQRCADALVGMEPMDDVLRQSGQFGPRIPVPEDAPAQDRLVGFIGRDPGWPAQDAAAR
ncbi:TIGR03086 family metal-binding protein [Nocardioides panacisoli]|uniref:TIGR03086 family metal-binding protein n=1 Tax=Nocardioides panacisoli TaxID=627624 RepID=UPI0031E0DAAA